jgi:hypothetical protein
VDDVADAEIGDVDRQLDRDVGRLAADLDRPHDGVQLTAVDDALVLAGELERHLGGDQLGRVDREQVDVADLAADDVELVLAEQRRDLAGRAVTFDGHLDHGVLLADRVERALERLDVDDDRHRVDATLGGGAVQDAGHEPAGAEHAGGALAGAGTSGDGELSDFDRHGVLWRLLATW